MQFQLLGPLEVTREGGRLQLGGPKQRLVLAHLLIRANELVSSDLLIDEIWGEEPPDAARQSLHSYVSHLRKALGADRLEGRAPGYILHAAEDEIDAKSFQALVAQARRRMSTDPVSAARTLRQALGLWRGDPLADLAIELSLQPEIERLSEVRLSAHEDLFEVELALGRHAETVAELDRLAAAYPLRERLCGQLMLALYRTGRQADALAAYHRLRATLDGELGLDPSPALETIQRQILNHDPALDLHGEPLRGYRVVGQIASGPSGIVHRAIDPHTEREVVIKVFGRQIANDADFVRRFDADASRVARLEHPHVVTLIDWWREPDAAYLVMRMMAGSSLADRLARGNISSTIALHWAEQIGAALGAAHRQNVVHGDVRPGNVLFDADDNAYLSDFQVGTDLAISAAGGTSGRMDRYLAPERRNGGAPSAGADIFALAIVLGELLRSLVDGPESSELSAVLAGATSPIPAERPATVAELVGAVTHAVLAPSAADRVARSMGGPVRNPYKGLRAFEEADAPDFVGREGLVSQLVARMADEEPHSRLLAVVGPSGSGKSSVVSAGLVPALRRGAVPGSDQWFVARMTPGHRPFEQLERALLAVAVNVPASLAELLHDDAGLRPAIDRVLPDRAQLVLVIDQFEELFTLSDATDRRRILEVLARTLDDLASRVSVVITLRADFYDRPLRHERFGTHLAAGTIAVPPLTPVELERSVTEPAERAGLRLEPGLVARIVAEMSDQPGSLPLLQYALSELWERRDGSRLSLAGYDASGGIAGAVSRRAEHLVTQLDADGQEHARQIFLRLVEPGEGTPDTARMVRLSELEAMSTDAMTMNEVTESFARYRLLLLDRDPDTREPTVELAHEALLRAWPRLQQWVDDARDDLRSQRRLAAAAAQWMEGGRDPSFLLTGSRLEQTETWANSTGVMLGLDTRDYLAASTAERRQREADEARRVAREATLENRALVRLRALVVVLALGALLASVLSVYALGQGDRAEREARNAQARELASAALANLDVDAERSVLLALEAIRTTRSVDGSVMREAEEALHSAVVASRIVLTVPDEGGEVDWAIMPDGRSVFASEGPEETGLVTIRDATTGAIVRRWRGHELDLNDIAFSADGSLIATAGDDGLLKVWRTSDGTLIAQVTGEGRVYGPSFGPDGSLVAAAWPDEGIVRVLDRSTGAVKGRKVQVRDTQTTAISPDGQQIAVGPVEGAVEVLDARSLAPVGSFGADGIESSIFGADFVYSPDGRWFAAGQGSNVSVWDTASGELRHSMSGHTGELWAIAWADDSRHLVTGSSDGEAIVWEIDADGYHRVLSFASQDLPGGIAGAVFEPGGARILLGGLVVGMVKIWDAGLQGDAERLNVAADQTAGAVGFTSERTVAYGTGDGILAEVDAATGAERPVIELDEDGLPIWNLETSPDGRAIAAIGYDKAWVWDADSGQAVRIPTEDQLRAIAWRPDGRQLVASVMDTATIQVLDRSGSVLRTSPGDEAYEARAVDVNDDGVVAVGEVPLGRADLARHRVTLRDGATGKVLRVLPAEGLADGIAFDPSGQRLALPFIDGRIEIRDLATDARTVLAGHVGTVIDVAWSPDGARLATSGGDGTIRIWDARTGEPKLVLRGHHSQVGMIRFSPDGSSLASTTGDGSVRIWALDLDDLIEIAAGNVTRELTGQECRDYLHVDACPTTSP